MPETNAITPAWDVVYHYLLESQRGRLTRGFASIPMDILTLVTGLRVSELRKTLRDMENENIIVIHQVDATAVDLAVTAVGIAKYISRVTP